MSSRSTAYRGSLQVRPDAQAEIKANWEHGKGFGKCRSSRRSIRERRNRGGVDDG